MLEYGKKCMLTQQEYDFLKYFFCEYAQESRQTNYYFDTNDFSMNRNGITCRIQQKNDTYTATIKKQGVQITDRNIEDNLATTDTFDSSVFSPFGIRLQGVLITERTTMHIDEGCKIFLDKNVYLGKTDYELEVEYLNGFEESAKFLLEEILGTLKTYQTFLGITPTPEILRKSYSKSTRFFKAKENMRG